MYPHKIIDTMPFYIVSLFIKNHYFMKHMRNIFRLPTESLKKTPNPSKSTNFSGHPHSIPLQLQFKITFTHISPYFTENIQRYGNNLKSCLHTMAATPDQTKMEALVSLAPGVSSSVIGPGHNLSQSQPSISIFKQFPKSNCLQSHRILPHSGGKKSQCTKTTYFLLQQAGLECVGLNTRGCIQLNSEQIHAPLGR